MWSFNAEFAKMNASCTDPGHLQTMFVNLERRKEFQIFRDIQFYENCKCLLYLLLIASFVIMVAT